jgi:hypothetical protein
MRFVCAVLLSGLMVCVLGCGGGTPTPEQKAKSDPTKAVQIMSKMPPGGIKSGGPSK